MVFLIWIKFTIFLLTYVYPLWGIISKSYSALLQYLIRYEELVYLYQAVELPRLLCIIRRRRFGIVAEEVPHKITIPCRGLTCWQIEETCKYNIYPVDVILNNCELRNVIAKCEMYYQLIRLQLIKSFFINASCLARGRFLSFSSEGSA